MTEPSPAAAVPVWEEPVRGGYPHPAIYKLSAPELLRVWRDRVGGPRPPISHLTGLDFQVFDDMTARFFMPASPRWLSSQGVISGGVLGIPADVALGCVVWLAAGPRTGLATSELSMNFVRPATPDSGELAARAKVIHVGKTLALAEAVVEDARGVLAHTTCRCVLFPIDPAMLGDDDFQPLAEPLVEVFETPDPHEREPEGEVLARESWENITGLEVLERQINGELAMPPIHHLTGIKPVSASEGTVRFSMPTSEWFASGFPTVLGGMVWLLAYSALASAIQTTLPVGSAHVPVDLKVNFLRPVYPNTGDLLAVGRVVHKGKTLAVADAEVFSADSKLIAVGRGTSQVLTGRAAAEAD